MTDKSWLLNAKAIAAARKCISIVEAELGIKLKLAHPDFLDLLVEYADLNQSAELEKALSLLAQYAPTKTLSSTNRDTPTIQASVTVATSEEDNTPKVIYHGKEYPRYQKGLEFQGLYRGQPRYA
ncbi:MAG: hypothetical protein AseanaTS_09370 [Candidatus Pelagadaptatus aseana]|uniref:hypothetical protein n=1 Tax=Candidatus Pelagadaptatus aseana TaxID=3120508 RepID=UPI0039B187FB